MKSCRIIGAFLVLMIFACGFVISSNSSATEVVSDFVELNEESGFVELEAEMELETEGEYEEDAEAEVEEEDEIVLPKKTIGEVGRSNFVDIVTLQGLDKITAKVHDFDVKVGSTVEYERLVIEVMKCWKSPPTQTPENKVLMKIWEKKPVADRRGRSLFSKSTQEKDYELEEVFFGWMFSSSPGLSGLEHSVYDITVIDCKDSSIQE